MNERTRNHSCTLHLLMTRSGQSNEDRYFFSINSVKLGVFATLNPELFIGHAPTKPNSKLT